MTEMFNFTQRHVTESLPRGGMKRRNSIGWECGLGFLGDQINVITMIMLPT